MDQQTILQSNLLDIIFENRNKDYGAYTLRKSYQGRLSIAVFSTAGVAVIFSLFLLSANTSTVFKPLHPAIVSPGPELSNFNPLPRANKKTGKQHAAKKSIPEFERPPVIVASDNINKLPATPPEILTSPTGPAGLEMTALPGEEGKGENNLNGDIITPLMKLAMPGEPAPLEVAEIMPQYPGGIPALLSFLKKNIHSPGDMEEGRDILVEIEFVVNYDGNLERFVVVQTGGEIFDNEVLRVLKKMPLWIPGKSKGTNVAAYYTVPVKFTNEF